MAPGRCVGRYSKHAVALGLGFLTHVIIVVQCLAVWLWIVSVMICYINLYISEFRVGQEINNRLGCLTNMNTLCLCWTVSIYVLVLCVC